MGFYSFILVPKNINNIVVFCTLCFQSWGCEFCSHSNVVDLDDEEIPKENDTTFMLQPAPCTAASGKTGVDDSLVIFCVDTSGSMCVTTEVCILKL